MGIQIAIAQSDEDERHANEWFASRHDLLCSPKLTTSPKPDPRPLGEHDARGQVIFLAESLDAIEQNWVAFLPAIDQQPQLLFHLNPKVSCIEWTRTDRTKDNRATGGRYFLNTRTANVFSAKQVERFKGREPNESAEPRRKLKGIMTSFISWIRRTYPGKGTLKPPIYVGPGMLAEIVKGKFRLVHGDGVTPVDLP